ncbi:MAG: glycosyltransferase [Flavobacteriales bacterium]|nr:glycosyltransferase [Flavobacteriales bacterium]
MSAFPLMPLVLFMLALVYASVVTGWREAISDPSDPGHLGDPEAPRLSLVVPARDEEDGIAALLQDLHAQDYPRDRMEVLVVDDGSTDRTITIVEGMMRSWPDLRLLRSDAPGKKAAITTGVNAATGDLILLTDADVRCGPQRARTLAGHWLKERSDLIVLPVWTAGHGILGRIQEDEQAALLGMSMGTASLAYGANLAFARAAFHSVGGYQNDRFASGDDVFLLQRMKGAGKSITILFHADAIVTAKAEPSLRTAILQRLRWAGKMRGVRGAMNLSGMLGLLLPWALLYQTLTFNFREGMGQHALFTAALLTGAWAVWMLPVIGLVHAVRNRMQRPASSLGTCTSFVAFACYAPIIAVTSLIVRPKWKGRNL